MSDDSRNPFAPPVEESAAPVARDEFRAALRDDTKGKRLAGWFFMANAAVSIVALFGTNMRIGLVGIGLDLLFGYALYRGYGSATALAVLRVGYGVLSGPWGYFIGISPTMAMMLYATGMMSLVIGKPSKERLVVGAVLFGAYLALFAAVVTLVVTGKFVVLDEYGNPR